MNDLGRRITRLETRHPVISQVDAATQARHQRRSADLIAFVKTAFPDSRDCVASHLAHIVGLPDAPAFRAYLQGQPLENVARDRYGGNWRTVMGATAAEAGARCLAAHGSDWWARFAAIWRGESAPA